MQISPREKKSPVSGICTELSTKICVLGPDHLLSSINWSVTYGMKKYYGKWRKSHSSSVKVHFTLFFGGNYNSTQMTDKVGNKIKLRSHTKKSLFTLLQSSDAHQKSPN